MRFIAAFLLLPLVEIALFVTVGSAIGLGWTLAIVIGSVLAGVAVIRDQNRKASIKLREALSQSVDPMAPIAGTALAMIAGLLLIVPGFLTDAVGLVLLFPPVRVGLLALLARNAVRVHVAGAAFRSRAQGAADDIIEGEYEDAEDASAPPTRTLPRPTHRPDSSRPH
jgi:UPF0716 protein FxsA